MKKTLIFLITTIIIIISFCGCRMQYEYGFEQPIEQVKQIFIVLEENGVEHRIKCSTDILTDIQSIPCRKYWNDPPQVIVAPYVLIEYKDGCIEEISADSNCYIIDGESDFDWEYFDSYEFLEVLKKYQ